MAVKTKEVAVLSDNGADIVPFGDKPDYLPATVPNSGMEGLGKDDYKTPRILLLQALSPQIQTFPDTAKPNIFWHTGLNVPLGPSFDFVPVLASKRVIIWRPRDDQGGGILAFSKDGKNWDTGANQEFRVKLKGKKDPVVWKSGKDVASSHLIEFGTSDTEDPQSAPAATVVYEYLCNIIKRPDLSPCVLGVSKTAIPNGKSFNTSLAMQVRNGKPIQCIGVKCFADTLTSDNNKWTVPNFQLMGFVSKELYEQTKKMADSYMDYKVEYSQEDEKEPIDIGDEIKY